MAKAKKQQKKDALENLKAAMASKITSKAETAKHAKIEKEATEYASHVVDVTAASHESVRKVMLEAFGKTAEFLASAKIKLKEAWGKYADGFTARGTHSDKATVEGMKRASIYNRNSEQQAILSAAEKYAIMNDGARKAFDSKLKDCTSYHALVAFCRHFNNAGKGKGESNQQNAVAKRERKAWQNKKSERIAKVKQTLRFATLDALIVLQEYIAKRITQEKASLEQKSRGERASVSKLRKAA